ncbi:hypothetical protein [Chondromyces apiculatus]|nr:hypothetical protein [Chondromyces apiculatus]
MAGLLPALAALTALTLPGVASAQEPVVLPRTLPFLDKAPPPPGYRLEMRPNTTMSVVGASIFGGAYVSSVLLAGTLVTVEGNNPEDWAALFAPIVGPFVTMGTGEDVGFGPRGNATAAVLLLVDGVTQVTGAALFIAGLMTDHKIWVRGDIPLKPQAERATPVPELMIGLRGAGLRMRF